MFVVFSGPVIIYTTLCTVQQIGYIMYTTERKIKFKLIRPPDIVCRRTYILLRILLLSSFSFFHCLIPELSEPATCSRVTAIWKRMSKIWSIPSSYKLGSKNDLFWTTLQLHGNVNGLYIWNETQWWNIAILFCKCHQSSSLYIYM